MSDYTASRRQVLKGIGGLMAGSAAVSAGCVDEDAPSSVDVGTMAEEGMASYVGQDVEVEAYIEDLDTEAVVYVDESSVDDEGLLERETEFYGLHDDDSEAVIPAGVASDRPADIMLGYDEDENGVSRDAFRVEGAVERYFESPDADGEPRYFLEIHNMRRS